MGRHVAPFLDTPVLLRRMVGHPAAEPFTTGILNLFEVVHILVRRGEQRAAGSAFDMIRPLAHELNRQRIFEASRLRVRHMDRGLSYADTAGYVTARELGARFVTSDRGFAGLPGVDLLSF